jgi:hypothetical protein
MADIINLKENRITFNDLLLAGAVKYFEERLLTPYIGNGTIISGGVKIIGAKYLGKHLPKPVRLALAIDGAEDIVNFGMNFIGAGNIFNGGASSENVQVI